MGVVADMVSPADILGCKVGSLPMTDLGLLLGSTFKARSIWGSKVEKVGKCLVGYLSKGGRVTLIKTMLCSIPTYFMSVFSLPIHAANKLEKLQRDFLWEVMGDTKKFHWLEWMVVCSPLKEGG